MADPAAFWNRIADRYARSPIKDVESYERTLECARKHLGAEDRVLEIGCGTGTTALRLAPAVREIVATDVSLRMIEIARGKAAAQEAENVRFEPAALADLDGSAPQFDAVMAFNLLHLVDDLQAAVAQVRELLRPGGLFISKTVCLGEQSGVWRLVLPVAAALRLAPRVRILSIAGLEDVIRAAGFEILETGFYPASPPSRFVVARRSGPATPRSRGDGRSG